MSGNEDRGKVTGVEEREKDVVDKVEQGMGGEIRW